jgi:hypothetical protein
VWRLQGSIPDYSSLPSLVHLALNNNQLTGGIPTQLECLQQLTTLLLHDNFLVGSVPLDLGARFDCVPSFFNNCLNSTCAARRDCPLGAAGGVQGGGGGGGAAGPPVALLAACAVGAAAAVFAVALAAWWALRRQRGKRPALAGGQGSVFQRATAALDAAEDWGGCDSGRAHPEGWEKVTVFDASVLRAYSTVGTCAGEGSPASTRHGASPCDHPTPGPGPVAGARVPRAPSPASAPGCSPVLSSFWVATTPGPRAPDGLQVIVNPAWGVRPEARPESSRSGSLSSFASTAVCGPRDRGEHLVSWRDIWMQEKVASGGQGFVHRAQWRGAVVRCFLA